MADEASLLETFKPFVRYDSNEAYFADSAAEMTDAQGNLLRTAAGGTIAAAGPGEHDLSLKFLAATGERYPTGQLVAEGDVLSVQGRDYLDQYRAIRVQPGYANLIYGRVVEASGAIWLQYWFWFFYNDLRALDIGLGLHEGDWEGIQLRMAGDEPDLAVYAQHAYGEAREWGRVKKQGQRPVVYVAQGSHASYFDDGMPITHWQRTEHFIDRADGKVAPKRDLALEVFSGEGPAWARWPGRWGDTKRPDEGPKPYKEISSGSPTGPGRKQHWVDPEWLLDKAEEVGRAPERLAPAPIAAPPRPATPRLESKVEEERLRVAYELAPSPEEQLPTHLLVTVNSPDDPFPPTTFRLPLEAARGTLEVPLTVDATRRYELRASSLTADGALSEVVTAETTPSLGDRGR